MVKQWKRPDPFLEACIRGKRTVCVELYQFYRMDILCCLTMFCILCVYQLFSRSQTAYSSSPVTFSVICHAIRCSEFARI